MLSSHNLIKKVIDTVKKYSMLVGQEKVLIGLSGGPDSVCLLHILNHLKDKFKINLHAIYIDHCLRPDETEAEIRFCKDLCEGLKVPFIAKSTDVNSYAKQHGINKQEAARQLRYRLFEETASEINAHVIALGHTADDCAETLLMHLIRGSGPKGLSGIPPIRGRIIRPLIEVERIEIEKFLDEERINFIVDSSNLKKDYLRNKIRLSLIPMLKEINPNIIGTLSRTAEIFREEERYFEIIVTKTLIKIISRRTDSRIELFIGPLEAMDKVLLRRTLRRAIEETRGLHKIDFAHIEDIIKLIKEGKTGDRLYLPGNTRAIKDYSVLVLTSEHPVKLNTYTLTVPGEIVLEEAKISIIASIAEISEAGVGNQLPGIWKTLGIFDADKLTFPLTVRRRKNGDFFYPFGFGRKKKLQDFFVDEKVPKDERDGIPLIVSGEDIIWVVGYRGDDRFKVVEETKRVLKLEVKKMRN